MELFSCFQHSEDVIAQRTGADLVLFHMESGRYFSLNELGAKIWELCDGCRPLIEVADQLEAEYDAPREVILQDCRELIDSLLTKSLLIYRRGENETSG